MKKIKLGRGKFALVDDEDYASVSVYKWRAHKSSSTENHYAVVGKRINGKYKTVYLHRLIMGASNSKVFIDHKNGNGLDCQKSNMRIATCSQNGMNRGSEKKSSCQYKGVTSYRNNRWRAAIVLNKKSMHIGYFNTKENAATAYNIFAEKYHGQFANYNKS